MATEYTPKYNLAKPLVNGPETENTWGFDLNLNFDKIDAAIADQIDPTEVAEIVDDRVANLIKPGANMAVTYNDAANTLTITGLMGQEEVQDVVGAFIQPGANISTTYSDASNTLTITGLMGLEEVQDIVGSSVSAGTNVAVAYDDGTGKVYISTAHSSITGGSLGNVFDSKAAAELATIGPGVKSLLLNGYVSPGDAGPPLTCKRLNAVPLASNKGWLRTADRFTADGVADATNGGYWGYCFGASPVYVEWFGGKADYRLPVGGDPDAAWYVNPAPTDNLTPFNDAYNFVIATVGIKVGGKPYFAAGPTIQLGYGAYYFSGTIMPTRTLQIAGQGGYMNTTEMVWPPGVNGIWFLSNDSRLPQPGSAFGILRDVTLRSKTLPLFADVNGNGGSPVVGSAIVVDAPTEVRNVSIYSFHGHGIDIQADVGQFSNANVFYLSHIFIRDCGGHGVVASGGDANAGTGIALNLVNVGKNNDGYGIYDYGFLGNTWVGCHAANCGRAFTSTVPFGRGGPYYGRGVNAPSVFVGCYAEGGQGRSFAGPLTTFLGGILASGMEYNSGIYVYGRNYTGGMTVTGSYASQLLGDPKFNIRTGDYILYSYQSGAGTPSQFKLSDFHGWWAQDYGTGNWSHGFTTEQGNYLAGRPRGEVRPNSFVVPGGIYLASNENHLEGRRIDSSAAAPTGTGVWARGEIRFARNPVLGGPVGWVCTQSGSSGYNTAWASGSDYAINNYVKVDDVNVYKCVVDPINFLVPAVPSDKTSTVRWIIAADKSTIRKDIGELITFSIYIAGTIPAGQTISVDVALGGTAVELVDYTPTFASQLPLNTQPGVSVSGSTVTLDGDLYVGNWVQMRFNARAGGPVGAKTMVGTLSNPVISGGGRSAFRPTMRLRPLPTPNIISGSSPTRPSFGTASSRR